MNKVIQDQEESLKQVNPTGDHFELGLMKRNLKIAYEQQQPPDLKPFKKLQVNNLMNDDLNVSKVNPKKEVFKMLPKKMEKDQSKTVKII